MARHEQTRKAGGGLIIQTKGKRTIVQLHSQIVEEFPSARIEFEPMPSGICWLNVRLGERDFVLELSPKHGAGVSENFEDTTPFESGHDRAFATLDEASNYLKQLLASAAEPLDRKVLTEQPH